MSLRHYNFLLVLLVAISLVSAQELPDPYSFRDLQGNSTDEAEDGDDQGEEEDTGMPTDMPTNLTVSSAMEEFPEEDEEMEPMGNMTEPHNNIFEHDDGTVVDDSDQEMVNLTEALMEGNMTEMEIDPEDESGSVRMAGASLALAVVSFTAILS